LWERWKKYAKFTCMEDDFYLKNFTQEERHVLICAFTMAVRDARFSISPSEKLVANTVRDTIQYVCATFCKNGHPNPTLDKGGKPAFILQQEFRSFKNTDLEEKHQKLSQYQSSVKFPNKTALSLNEQQPNSPSLNLLCNDIL
jgi:hypothetical protein